MKDSTTSLGAMQVGYTPPEPGVAPDAVIAITGPGSGATNEQINPRVFQPIVWDVTASSAQLRFYRTDNAAWADAQAVNFLWQAIWL